MGNQYKKEDTTMKTLKVARVAGYTSNSFTRKPKRENALIQDWPK
jgi:hypothetical protein